MQPQAHVQVVTALLDDALSPQAALDRPRVCIDPNGGPPQWPADANATTLLVEEGIPRSTYDALAVMGHPVQRIEGFARLRSGRGQIIRRLDNGALEGGSDPRADGGAAQT